MDIFERVACCPSEVRGPRERRAWGLAPREGLARLGQDKSGRFQDTGQGKSSYLTSQSFKEKES